MMQHHHHYQSCLYDLHLEYCFYWLYAVQKDLIFHSTFCSDVRTPVDETSSAVAGIVMQVRIEESNNNLVDITPGSAVTIGTQLAITFEHQSKFYHAVKC